MGEILANSVGTAPVSRLLSTVSEYSFESFPSSVGSEEESRFPLRRRVLESDVKRPIWVGTVPESELPLRAMEESDRSSPSVVASVPDSLEDERKRLGSRVSRASCVGSVPLTFGFSWR